jgi:nucleotide-binding universal stress UspA family protein
MAIKDILVHVDPLPRSAVRLEVATILARRCGAHLAGVYVQPPRAAPSYAPPELRQAFERLNAEAEQRAVSDAKTLFERQMAGTQLATEWRHAQGLVDDQVALHARYADLAVLGQPARDESDPPPLDETGIDRIILATGRPVLIVPYAGRFDTVGTRILVAWDASREATRAIADALPLLAAADAVTVLSVNPRRGIHGHGDVPSADIALHLARHGVKVEAMRDIARDISVADVLLSRAADLSADLIVMGAYGHPRVLELALGGVTRSILKHMTVPVLMSH